MCTNGKDAWRLLSEDNIKCDMVLTDLMMPGITGADLLEMVRSHPDFHSLPVILMSGEDKTPETAASAIREGSQDFLFKPLIKPLLIKKISTVLENWIM
jgi:DNA-binding NtrC family response regulator